MARDIEQVHIHPGNTIIVMCGDGSPTDCTCRSQPRSASAHDREAARRTRGEMQRRIESERASAERSWARTHPYLHAEGGSAAFDHADERTSAIRVLWILSAIAVVVLWAFRTLGLPGGLLANAVAIVLGTMIIGGLALIPAVLVTAIPAKLHAWALDRRAERAARLRAEPQERAERLARVTADNDRRLRELGIDA